jgi:hypothetical protein
MRYGRESRTSATATSTSPSSSSSSSQRSLFSPPLCAVHSEWHTLLSGPISAPSCHICAALVAEATLPTSMKQLQSAEREEERREEKRGREGGEESCLVGMNHLLALPPISRPRLLADGSGQRLGLPVAPHPRSPQRRPTDPRPSIATAEDARTQHSELGADLR